MLELFGFAWVTITFTACVGAIATRRSVLRWLRARTDRKRLDDTVEIVRRRPLVDMAGHVVLVLMLAVPAAVLAGGGALPGPSGGGGGLPLTGGTMTGQVVFSAVTTDISTGTNESLTLAPNGTGNMLVPNSDIIVSGTAGQMVEVDVDTGGATIQLHTDDAANGASFMSWNTAKSLVVSNIGYFAASYPENDYQDKTIWYSYGKTMELSQYLDVAAGTIAFRFTDNATGSAALLVSIDGAGNLFLNTAATRTKGTITLSAGTGTATVSSGCTPSCSDTTAINAVQCSVSGTTLTANGTGTDVISYHCL